MQIKLDRIISIATLAALIVAIVLVLKKPAPVAQPQAPAGVATSAQSSNAGSVSQKEDQPEPAAKQTQPVQQSQAGGGYFAAPQPAQNPPAPQSPKTEARSNSDAIGAAVSQLLGANRGAGGAEALSPDSDVGSETPNIKDQKVDYDGDLVHGQFLTEIAGKDVWVTISGHMGQKDGYATFEPTEFKVGDMEVPVSLVNPALQRKLAEERDRLKMSDPAGAK
jgi:hypothetical protein